LTVRIDPLADATVIARCGGSGREDVLETVLERLPAVLSKYLSDLSISGLAATLLDSGCS
jgi:hypothetical protein